MSALVEQTLAELRSDVATVRDALWRSAGFFEHAAGNPNSVEPHFGLLRRFTVGTPPPAAVAEPMTLALVVGMVGICGVARRRTRVNV